MKALICQSTPDFGDVAANLSTVERCCASASMLEVDVAVFPEMFLTGYNLGNKVAELAEAVDGPSMKRLSEIARQSRIAIVTGFAERRDGEFYNSAVAISTSGAVLAHHNKVFLFGEAEKQLYRPGSSFPVFELAGRKCGLSICYDIEFPEVARDMKRRGVEVIFVPTANMEPYYEVPTTLVRARALESGIAVVYANLSGSEGDQHYTGMSAVVLPDGKDLMRAGSDSCILIGDLAPGLGRNDILPFSSQMQDLNSTRRNF
jgi:5-aminopentanamidase